MFRAKKGRVVLLGLVVVLVLAMASPALAGGKGNGKGRGGGGGGDGSTGSISLDQANPQFRDTVTFTISWSSSKSPWVKVTCRQGGVLVYQQTHGFFTGYLWDQTYTLGPTSYWTSGDADCVGDLGYSAKNGRWRPVASTTFHVSDVGTGSADGGSAGSGVESPSATGGTTASPSVRSLFGPVAV